VLKRTLTAHYLQQLASLIDTRGVIDALLHQHTPQRFASTCKQQYISTTLRNNMSSDCLSETMASLHESRSVDLEGALIGAGAIALADALKANTSVTTIKLGVNVLDERRSLVQ
jgi:hypothetical protein